MISLVVSLLATWLTVQASAMTLADKCGDWEEDWDVGKLRKRFHDPSREPIDLACDACKVLVDGILCLARQICQKMQ